MRQRRLRPAVAAQRVAVLGRDVRRQRRARGQVAAAATAAAALLHLHGLLAVGTARRQEGVAEQLAQQGILGEVVQELREVLQGGRGEEGAGSGAGETVQLERLAAAAARFLPFNWRRPFNFPPLFPLYD